MDTMWTMVVEVVVMFNIALYRDNKENCDNDSDDNLYREYGNVDDITDYDYDKHVDDDDDGNNNDDDDDEGNKNNFVTDDNDGGDDNDSEWFVIIIVSFEFYYRRWGQEF